MAPAMSTPKRTKKRRPWPAGKPVPNFKTLGEEEAF
jgi:hypothetical protein